jgi:hypothetical protein
LISETAKSAILAIVSSIDSQILALESEMKKIIEENKEISDIVNAFMGIKGVGFLTACAVISGMPDVKNFSNAKEYAAFIGITPTVFESGSSVKKRPKISKIGDKYIRNTLYMSSISVKNHNKHFSDFVQRLEKKGKPPRVIFCAVMRKLMHIFFGMLKNNATFNVATKQWCDSVVENQECQKNYEEVITQGGTLLTAKDTKSSLKCGVACQMTAVTILNKKKQNKGKLSVKESTFLRRFAKISGGYLYSINLKNFLN